MDIPKWINIYDSEHDINVEYMCFELNYKPQLISDSPYHYLMAAILYRALADLEVLDTIIAKGALRWFLSNDYDINENGFTYKEILHTLNFTPSQLTLISNKIAEAKKKYD